MAHTARQLLTFKLVVYWNKIYEVYVLCLDCDPEANFRSSTYTSLQLLLVYKESLGHLLAQADNFPI